MIIIIIIIVIIIIIINIISAVRTLCFTEHEHLVHYSYRTLLQLLLYNNNHYISRPHIVFYWDHPFGTY
jgi:hypothetical protein